MWGSKSWYLETLGLCNGGYLPGLACSALKDPLDEWQALLLMLPGCFCDGLFSLCCFFTCLQRHFLHGRAFRWLLCSRSPGVMLHPFTFAIAGIKSENSLFYDDQTWPSTVKSFLTLCYFSLDKPHLFLLSLVLILKPFPPFSYLISASVTGICAQSQFLAAPTLPARNWFGLLV